MKTKINIFFLTLISIGILIGVFVYTKYLDNGIGKVTNNQANEVEIDVTEMAKQLMADQIDISYVEDILDTETILDLSINGELQEFTKQLWKFSEENNLSLKARREEIPNEVAFFIFERLLDQLSGNWWDRLADEWQRGLIRVGDKLLERCRKEELTDVSGLSCSYIEATMREGAGLMVEVTNREVVPIDLIRYGWGRFDEILYDKHNLISAEEAVSILQFRREALEKFKEEVVDDSGRERSEQIILEINEKIEKLSEK